MKIAPQLLAALILAASSYADASSCLDTRLIMKVEMAVQEAMLDACLEKKDISCKAALEYIIGKKDYLKGLTARYKECLVELVIEDQNEVRSIREMIERVSDRLGRVAALVEKTGGKF